MITSKELAWVVLAGQAASGNRDSVLAGEPPVAVRTGLVRSDDFSGYQRMTERV